MYTLYAGKYTRAILCEMVMVLGDIAHQRIDMNLLAGDLQSADFARINPTKLVPALLTHDGQLIHETAAINLFLCETHELNDLVPHPASAQRAEFLSKLFFITSELEPAIKRYFYAHRYAPDAEELSWTRSDALAKCHGHFTILEQHLKQYGPYVLGEQRCLLDITVTFWLIYLESILDYTSAPALQNLQSSIIREPKLTTLWQHHQQAAAEYRNTTANSTAA